MSVEEVRKRLAAKLPEWKKKGLSEAQTSQAMILPMLRALGFNPDDPFEVVPEDPSVGGARGSKNRPDYLLVDHPLQNGDHGRRCQLIVEVKALNKALDENDKQQLADYVNSESFLRWGVLTNGQEWHILDHYQKEKPGKDKYVLTIDLKDEEAARYMTQAFSKDVVFSENFNDVLSERVTKINEDIRRRNKLEQIEKKLRKELSEGLTQDKAGLQKAIRLALEPNERELAEECFDELVTKFFNNGPVIERQNETGAPAPKELQPEIAGSDRTAEAIRRGISRTSGSRGKDLKVWLDDKELPNELNWRNLVLGLAEALIELGHEENLDKLEFVLGEESKNKESLEKLSTVYRELKNKKFVRVDGDAVCNEKRVRALLKALDISPDRFRVQYEGDEIRF